MYTVRKLNCNISLFPIESNYIVDSSVESVPSLIPRAEVEEEYLDKEILRIKMLSSVTNFTIVYLGAYYHPNIVTFHNRTLLVSRSHDGPFYERPLFYWLQKINDSFYNISAELKINNSGFLVGAEQLRQIYLPNGNIFYSFTTPIGKWWNTRMMQGEITYDDFTNTISASSSPVFIERPEDNGEKQKNWTPFLYNKTVYYIHTIYPLTIVSSTGSFSPSGAIQAKTLSVDNCASISWEYGKPRGGTPAVLIDDEFYLSFFHSISSPASSYWMGAFTFTKSLPFRLLQISSVPIVHESWYKGIHFDSKFSFIPYPIGFEIEESFSKEKNVLVSMSTQDKIGLIIKFSLNDLMNSLVHVKYKCELPI